MQKTEKIKCPIVRERTCPMKIGYMRVSTDKQDTALQEDALNDADCEKIYSDRISGKTTSRPAFDLMLSEAKPGDVIVVWKLDRLGRSLIHVVQTVNDFAARDIEFISLTEVIDTTSPMGEFTFHLMAALAHLERRIIGERTRAGLAATKARGTRLGRPKTVQPHAAAILGLQAEGHSIRDIARMLGINRGKVQRICAPRAALTAAVEFI